MATKTYATRAHGRIYALRGAGTRWRLELWDSARALEPSAVYALDYDARHRRLFLSTRDERAIGVRGQVVLEALARRALPGGR